MRDRKLATRYARALLGALPDAPSQDHADTFLSALAESMQGNPELRGFLLNPASPTSAKKALFEKLVASRDVPPRVATFLAMVVDHGRIGNLASIAEVFHLEREAAQGSVSATLTTATPMAPELAARAAAALEKLAGRKVILHTQIDPALLGGAVATVGSMVYDGSVKTQLARLRRTMGED
jgi:F-type H+-transporting ATPase subunit delta